MIERNYNVGNRESIQIQINKWVNWMFDEEWDSNIVLKHYPQNIWLQKGILSL